VLLARVLQVLEHEKIVQSILRTKGGDILNVPINQILALWQKRHSESTARFDKLSDRLGDEESISSHLRFFPPESGMR